MARLGSFSYLGLISDPLVNSKFHNKTHGPKGQENKIYTIVNGRETLYPRHTVPITSCREVKYVLKKVILWKQRMHKRTETRVCKFYWPEVRQCIRLLQLINIVVPRRYATKEDAFGH